MNELKTIDHGNGRIEKILVDVPTLQSAKLSAIAKVNPEARRRISALDWKVTRASERKQRGRATQAILDAVLDERENIRMASDAAITAINALTTIESVKQFTW